MAERLDLRRRYRVATLRRFLRFWVLRIALLPIVVLPPRAARAAGAVFGLAAWILFPGLRRRTRRHLRLAFPVATDLWIDRTARGVFRWVGRAGADFLHLDRFGPTALADLEVEGRGHWDAARARGRGVILVTGHLGNWEVLGAWLATLGTPVWVIYHPFREKRLDRFVYGRRERVGVRGIPAEGSPLRALRALRRGEILGILLDRVPRGESVACTFFGRECRAASGPARLALATGAPVVPACLVYRQGVMRVRFEPAIDSAEVPAGADLGDVLRESTQRQARVLEDWIRDSPEQWPWFYDRWKVRGSPAGGVVVAPGHAPAPPGGVREADRTTGGSIGADREAGAASDRRVRPPGHQRQGSPLGSRGATGRIPRAG
jgi:Kdo2-lipid IVA lauroyltransferase/acyltransferase